ncbi:MAG: serine hydrolase domain-containing protein, partial [Pseudomonadota bacterium]
GAYLYSNLGFALLAQTVATSQSEDFHTLLRQTILSELDMHHTVIVRLLGPRMSRLPMGYDLATGSPVPVKTAGASGFPAMGGAGAIVSTPKDMMRWLRWNMGLRAEDPLNDLLPALQTPSTRTTTGPGGKGSELGLSWFIAKQSPPRSPAYDLVWKDGLIPGFSSFICLSSSESPGKTPSDYGCFVLTNSEKNGPNALYLLCTELMEIMRSPDAPD